MTHAAKPWLTDVEGPNFIAARKATKHVYKVEPDLTREGGSIPVTLALQVISLFIFGRLTGISARSKFSEYRRTHL